MKSINTKRVTKIVYCKEYIGKKLLLFFSVQKRKKKQFAQVNKGYRQSKLEVQAILTTDPTTDFTFIYITMMS